MKIALRRTRINVAAPVKWQAMVNYLTDYAMRALALVLLLSASFLWLPAITALADQANPDSTPTINGGILGIDVYRNLLETGDRGFLVYANIPYATPPTTPENEAFIWQLLSPDGLTVIGQTTGYPYHNLGYDYNAYWFYFSSADSVTWGSAYIMRLTGNPAIFLSPPTYDYVLAASDYNSQTTQAGNQGELEARILAISTDLYTRWSLSPTTKLTKEGETGTVLSPSGETFWRGAIYGCQALAPGVFEFGALSITTTSHSSTKGYADNLTGQYAGSWIATAKQGGADFFDLDYDLVSTLLVLIVCVGVMFLEQYLSDNIWFGLMDASLIAVIFGRQGLYDVTFLAMIAALLWIYVSARVWGLVR